MKPEGILGQSGMARKGIFIRGMPAQFRTNHLMQNISVMPKIIFDKIVDFHRGCWYKTIDTSLSDFALLDTKIPKMELTL